MATGIPAATTAADATQRSCWRSSPLARRKRTTSEAPPTTTLSSVIASAGSATAMAGAPGRGRSTDSGTSRRAGTLPFRSRGRSPRSTTVARRRRSWPTIASGGRQRAGRREQQDEAHAGRPEGESVAERANLADGRDRPRAGQEPVPGVAVGRPVHDHREPQGQHQPADGMPRPAAGQHCPDRRHADHRSHASPGAHQSAPAASASRLTAMVLAAPGSPPAAPPSSVAGRGQCGLLRLGSVTVGGASSFSHHPAAGGGHSRGHSTRDNLQDGR
jgi:hypothetical protein